MQCHPLSADALILSFRTMFSSDDAGDLKASIELRLSEDRFHADITDGSLSHTAARPPTPTPSGEGEAVWRDRGWRRGFRAVSASEREEG